MNPRLTDAAAEVQAKSDVARMLIRIKANLDEAGIPNDLQVKVGTPDIPGGEPNSSISAEVLHGRGPRRGGLEKLLNYWRPIMKKPGGWTRCVATLSKHPELGPNIKGLCAWIHHETTGKWPNEGCHHPGMKNCRRKLRRVTKP